MAYFWSSSEYEWENDWTQTIIFGVYQNLGYDYTNTQGSANDKGHGFSIRCLED
jgi:hypothetical protein